MNQANETGPRFSISARIRSIKAGLPGSRVNVQLSTFHAQRSMAGVECWALSVERLPPRLREVIVPQLENIHDIPEASAGPPLSSALVFAAAILHPRGH